MSRPACLQLGPALLAGGLCLHALTAGGAPLSNPPGTWADFVEPGFPFFSSVVDARKSGGPTNNLTPRGLVLNLGHGAWACLDVDLLRVSAVWQGPGLSPVSMSQGSYHTAGRKVSDGQGTLPVPQGALWLASGIYPGWQIGEAISLEDPREPAPDPREVGRGPLPAALGRFRAVQLAGNGVQLEYDVAGTAVTERWRARTNEAGLTLERHLRCAPASRDRWLVAGLVTKDSGVQLNLATGTSPGATARLEQGPGGLAAVRVPASTQPLEFTVSLTQARRRETSPAVSNAREKAPRWPDVLTTRVQASTAPDAFVVDDIELPLDNPWRRNVRLADLAFLGDGRAAAVTFDGDVWWIEGLHSEDGMVRWRRFASGLHEPLSLVVADGHPVVYDRNGLWRLRDTDGDGEADRHELVSNAFAQTAETREFVTGMRRAPDGAFIVSKGGQQTTTIGRHNGTVLRVPADGGPAEVLSYGLRMPFIGVHPRTGLVTASDQQGHYVPATPLHRIGDRRFHGFISLLLPKEKYPAPIADPLTWIPHPVNASGASQVWLTDARMGPLDGAMIHVGYYRPELFVVRLADRADQGTGAAVLSLTRDLAFPPLNGAVNPVDGRLYVTGFQIWGTEARQISGLARVRPTGRTFTIPREVIPMREGVLLRFDSPVDAGDATNAVHYSADRWNYRRSAAYGSPHFKLDGSKGQDALIASSAYVSRDGRGVFVGLPDMRPVMQMRLGWTLRMADGTESRHNAYFSPSSLASFAPEREGFAPLTVDLTPRRAAGAASTPVTAAEGRRVAELMGCVACHSTDGTTLGKVGPSWKGLFGSERRFADGSKARADEAYLREAIREPSARIVVGFDKTDTGMPSYEGVITDSQIEALVEYLKTVR